MNRLTAKPIARDHLRLSICRLQHRQQHPQQQRNAKNIDNSSLHLAATHPVGLKDNHDHGRRPPRVRSRSISFAVRADSTRESRATGNGDAATPSQCLSHRAHGGREGAGCKTGSSGRRRRGALWRRGGRLWMSSAECCPPQLFVAVDAVFARSVAPTEGACVMQNPSSSPSTVTLHPSTLQVNGFGGPVCRACRVCGAVPETLSPINSK